MSVKQTSKQALTGTAFIILLLVGLIMGSNHIAARIAFNHGLDVGTAVVIRSVVTALVVSTLVFLQNVPVRFTKRHWKALPLIGVLVSIQSLSLYSAVARLPVSLALLAFNTYPLWITLWARLIYKERAEPLVLKAMPIMLLGLALALDVLGTSSGLGLEAHWMQIGSGVAFALTAAATFGLAMVLTQHEAGDLDGRLRTAVTMAMVAVLSFAGVELTTGLHWPDATAGWWGLAGLTFFYGTGFTMMFTILPKVGAVGNSAIMNVEPIFALILGWIILGQTIAVSQVVGACIVVGTVIMLGLRRR